MKDALLHHFIQSRTLVAHFDTPDGRLPIPDRIAIFILDGKPQIMEPGLLRGLVLDLMGLVIDQCREGTTTSTKGQTCDPAPALFDRVRTIDHSIIESRGRHESSELSPRDKMF